MIVVDASALSAFILKEPGWRALSKYLINSVSVDHIVKEVTNSIWKACVLKKIMSINEALKLYMIMSSMIGVNIVLEPEDKYIEKALKIALNHKITVYDALYLALAKEKNLPLLTLDEKQAQVAERLGIEIIHFKT
ncbi:type II toxin-antitoxin system VapC family toxin [Desulfurococcaceae archaeon MEX13E-LK6-19]|nr:type II toxin-antitoxin system VapC family toxin [Desulfurococcaceae archaeon MEX13E-LK6-19]